jgi:hypothetical protein
MSADCRVGGLSFLYIQRIVCWRIVVRRIVDWLLGVIQIIRDKLGGGGG